MAISMSTLGIAGINTSGSASITSNAATSDIVWSAIQARPTGTSNKMSWNGNSKTFACKRKGWYRITIDVSFFSTVVSANPDQINVELYDSTGGLGVMAKSTTSRVPGTISVPNTRATASFNRIVLFPNQNANNFYYAFRIYVISGGTSNQITLNDKDCGFTIQWLRGI